MKAIEVQQLVRMYGKIHAVDGISFDVEEGEFFGFLGPNGAGKTTTISMLTGSLRPTSGWARVAGCDVVREREALKPQIGVVFEYQNLYQRLSARDNLVFTAGLYGVPKSRVEEVLEQVGLTSMHGARSARSADGQDRSGDSLKKYSNGMKQRLLIARALLHKPRVLFLDEPTRGLDPAMARSIRSLAADLAKAGMTIFLTTHYMEEADQLCGRVAILDQGRIVALDSPAALKRLHGDGQNNTLEDVFIRLTGKELAI